MSHESPSSPESSETLYNKALAIAQEMSQRWKEIPEGLNQVWQAESPSFASMYNLSSKKKEGGSGKTGIQRFFESRMSEIEVQKPDPVLKNEMLRRLTIELKKFQDEMNDIIKEYKK